ncbi:MAG: Arylsulfatase [Lentisphaerae bacterium ADurb.BinA184]|nr:MAG: Arylsulfatase [Lentisphaerae bacterium ADurb.BinA184]
MTPNILFFFTDQQRWDTCGCYGQRLPVTPNLDRMAAEGIRFENTFTCQPVCGPARACLQTGKWATETGVFRNGIALPPGETTIAHRLAAAGYEVGYLGKWHLASNRFGPHDNPEENFERRPVPSGRRGGYRDFWLASDVLEFTSHSYDGHLFDSDGNPREFPPGRYRADALGDWTLEYLETRDRRRPFFLFVSFIEPHHQNDHHCYEGPHGSKQRWAEYDVPGDLAGTAGDWRESFPDYLGCCHSLDANLGRVRAKLDELDLADNTLVIFTSDHGSHFCTRNSEYKRACHDGCIRVPLVVTGPGFRGGRVIEDLVSLIDLPPTVLAAGGVAESANLAGRPLQDLVAGRALDWPDDVFLQISEDHIGRAVRTRRWKYEVWVPSAEKWSGSRVAGATVYHECHLYDLASDAHERSNLVRDPAFAAVRAEMAARLRRRMALAHEPVPEIRPAE